MIFQKMIKMAWITKKEQDYVVNAVGDIFTFIFFITPL